MQIFSTSVEQIKEQFLHAGYISSCPCSQSDSAFGDSDSVHFIIDMKNALELKSAETLSSESSILSGIVSFFKSNDFLLLITATLTLFFIFYVVSRLLKKFPKIDRGLTAFFSIAITLSLIVYSSCGGTDEESPESERSDSAPTEITDYDKQGLSDDDNEIPDENITSITEIKVKYDSEPDREYKYPEKATNAILYGFIADALSDDKKFYLGDYDSGHEPIYLLNNIKIPTANPTSGITYASEHPYHDGWGNLFKFEYVIFDNNKYNPSNRIDVTSSGEDGIFNTADDIKIEIIPSDFYYESYVKNSWTTFFITKYDYETIGIFRSDKYYDTCDYQYKDKELGQTLTGDSGFDARTLDDNLEKEFEFENNITEDSLIILSFKLN